MSNPLVEVDLRRTVHERVRQVLREDILSGVLRPGEHLRQSALAAELRVSVAPVREALRDLAAEGFVRFDPRRGASVRQVDLEEFGEIRGLLEAVEPFVAELLVRRATPDDVAELSRLQDELERTGSPDRFRSLDTAFHDVLLRATRSPRVQAVVESLQGACALVVVAAQRDLPHQVERAVREHRPLLAALVARDAAALTEASLAHRRPVWDAVEAAVRPGAPPVGHGRSAP